MLDGRIDTQGAVTSLEAQGVLDDISRDEAVEARKEQEAANAAAEQAKPDEAEAAAEAVQGSDDTNPAKKPRQLVKDEHREIGGVKWSVYQTYLKAW